MLSLEVTGILGSVAGIAEIAKEAFKSQDDIPPSGGFRAKRTFKQ